MKKISHDEAIATFTSKIQNDFKVEPVFVACAYWCEDAWPICSGTDENLVKLAAENYISMWPRKFNSEGDFVNGHGCDGCFVTKVPMVSQSIKTQPPSPDHE